MISEVISSLTGDKRDEDTLSNAEHIAKSITLDEVKKHNSGMYGRDAPPLGVGKSRLLTQAQTSRPGSPSRATSTT